jgi:hypothetical protein
MAMFIDKCAICEEKITQDTPYISTSGCAFPEGHDLWKYCDTGLHQQCLLSWKHRVAFSSGYFSLNTGAHELILQDHWKLTCGPLVYGPQGKVSLPYYAQIEFCEWPGRLYSKFLDWPEYISSKPWEASNIPELNSHIESFFQDFPKTVEKLQELLLPHIIKGIKSGEHHKQRYVFLLSLDLFDNNLLHSFLPVFESSLKDEHGSVRQAAHMLLKRLKK